MSEQKKRRFTRTQLGAIVATVAVSLSVIAFLGWSITCPCDLTPGGLLFGDQADEEITDWSFANDVSLWMPRLLYVSFLGRANLGRPSEPPNVHTNAHTLFSAGFSGSGKSAYLRDGSSTEGP